MIGKKLVLFDIDGTLIYHVGLRKWNEQYKHGMRVTYGVSEPQDYSKYNGSVEMHMAWDIAQKYGVSRGDFLTKFPSYIQSMIEHLDDWRKRGPVFQPIPEAVNLVGKLLKRKEYILGVLTGNAKRIADWKLSHTGLLKHFSFGLYGQEADDRISLAKLVFTKAKRELGEDFAPQDIIVIGDTVYDIRCAKAIGARVIAVTTGMHGDPAVLEKELPDLLVTSLADLRVSSLFSLK